MAGVIDAIDRLAEKAVGPDPGAETSQGASRMPPPPKRTWYVTVPGTHLPDEVNAYFLEFSGGVAIFHLNWDEHQEVLAYAPGQWKTITDGATE